MGLSVKNQNRMANTVDPDETAQYEPSYLYLRCLQMYLLWSAGLIGLNQKKFKYL